MALSALWYQNGTIVTWHAGGSFTTADPCLNVINVTATPLSSSKVEVCWDTVSTYAFVRIKYRVDTAASAYNNIGGMGVFSPLLCKQKNGLVANTDYRVIYRTWCNASGGAYRSPQWDGPIFFTTPSVIRSNFDYCYHHRLVSMEQLCQVFFPSLIVKEELRQLSLQHPTL